jgi:hypothetical protein
VIWGDHRVELPTHCPHEHGVRRKGSGYSRLARGRSQQVLVLIAETSAVARVRVERAERDARLGDAEPLLQPCSRDARRFGNGFRAQFFRDSSQRKVCGGEHDAQLVRCEHHRHPRAGEHAQHLCVAREVVATGVESCLVNRRSDDPLHHARDRQIDHTYDGEAAQPSREGGATLGHPPLHRLADRDTRPLRPHHRNVTALDDPGVGERLGNDLRTNSAGITHGHG